MHIVLDGSPLTIATGGIRRYTEQLAVALQKLPHDDEITLACDRPLLNASVLADNGIRVIDEPARGWRKRWWSLGAGSACRSMGASVFHGTDFTVPYLHPCASVLTIHDLSPWRYPRWQPEAGRIRQRTPWLLRLGRADMVITVSEAVRRETITRFSLAEEQVVTTPLAADERFRPVSGALPPAGLVAAHAPEDFFKKPWFLFVGTIEPRKNVATLIQAWEELSAGEANLCIVGRLRADGVPIPVKPGLRWMPAASDEDLIWLYTHATAVLYPSHYEGFGLPVLEAMQCGAPVVTGDSPALAELVGDAGIVLPPNDARAWTSAMRRILDDSSLRPVLSTKALNRSAAFRWSDTARRTREVYREAITRFGR